MFLLSPQEFSTRKIFICKKLILISSNLLFCDFILLKFAGNDWFCFFRPLLVDTSTKVSKKVLIETDWDISKYQGKLFDGTNINKSQRIFYWNQITTQHFYEFFERNFVKSSAHRLSFKSHDTEAILYTPRAFLSSILFYSPAQTHHDLSFCLVETCGVESCFFLSIQSILYWPISFNLVLNLCLLSQQTWIEFYRPLSVFRVQWELNFCWWRSFIVREHNKKMLYSWKIHLCRLNLGVFGYLTLSYILLNCGQKSLVQERWRYSPGEGIWKEVDKIGFGSLVECERKWVDIGR